QARSANPDGSPDVRDWKRTVEGSGTGCDLGTVERLVVVLCAGDSRDGGRAGGPTVPSGQSSDPHRRARVTRLLRPLARPWGLPGRVYGRTRGDPVLGKSRCGWSGAEPRPRLF